MARFLDLLAKNKNKVILSLVIPIGCLVCFLKLFPQLDNHDGHYHILVNMVPFFVYGFALLFIENSLFIVITGAMLLLIAVVSPYRKPNNTLEALFVDPRDLPGAVSLFTVLGGVAISIFFQKLKKNKGKVIAEKSDPLP